MEAIEVEKRLEIFNQGVGGTQPFIYLYFIFVIKLRNIQPVFDLIDLIIFLDFRVS